jgi:hypothetical protein
MHHVDSRPNLRLPASLTHALNPPQHVYPSKQGKAIKIPQSSSLHQSTIKPWRTINQKDGGPTSSGGALNSDISRIDKPRDYETTLYALKGAAGM